MNILGNISIDDFLNEYWQKKPLLIRNAFENYQSPIEPDDLAGLSMEEEVESRLIYEQGKHAKWELHNGPFAEEVFAQLPEEKWTLLVQAVDQWVPDIADLLKHFNFIPNWRLDDIMASFAPKGGSVGPHYDQYDVFLLQAHGQRHWQVGPRCTDETELVEDTELKIIKNMQVDQEWTLNPGDMLYIPPQYAHNGIAVDDCMTFSIGFRAPSETDILTHFTDHLSLDLADNQRYTDADIKNAEASPAFIDEQAIERLQAIISKHTQNTDALKNWFAQYMTQSKYEGLHEHLEDALEWDELAPFLEQDNTIIQNETTRWAYYTDSTGTHLVINGEETPFAQEPACIELCQKLANQRLTQTQDISSLLDNPHCQQLMLDLFNCNYLYFSES